jgi:hypothetical protein
MYRVRNDPRWDEDPSPSFSAMAERAGATLASRLPEPGDLMFSEEMTAALYWPDALPGWSRGGEHDDG